MTRYRRKKCSCCDSQAWGNGFICWCADSHRRAFKVTALPQIPNAVRQIFAAPQIFMHPQTSIVVSAGSLFFSMDQAKPYIDRNPTIVQMGGNMSLTGHAPTVHIGSGAIVE